MTYFSPKYEGTSVLGAPSLFDAIDRASHAVHRLGRNRALCRRHVRVVGCLTTRPRTHARRSASIERRPSKEFVCRDLGLMAPPRRAAAARWSERRATLHRHYISSSGCSSVHLQTCRTESMMPPHTTCSPDSTHHSTKSLATQLRVRPWSISAPSHDRTAA